MEAETGQVFPTTRRSLVADLSASCDAVRTEALEVIARTYWPAVYSFLRRRGQSRADAEDLTQGFFAHVVEKSALGEYDPSRARFRTWIRLLLDRFVASEFEANSRQKRGGGRAKLSLDFAAAEAQLDLTDHGPTPEQLFDQEWVRSVFREAVDRLEEELFTAGRDIEFTLFERYDIDGPNHSQPTTYRSLGEEYGISESQVTNMLHRTRSRFRRIVETIVSETASSPAEARRELEDLLGPRS